MNNIYTETFSEAFAESNPYEYKQKYTSKNGKQSYINSNETSLTKKAKSYKQARDAKRMNWERD